MENKSSKDVKNIKQAWSLNIVENKKGDGLTKIVLSGNMGARVVK